MATFITATRHYLRGMKIMPLVPEPYDLGFLPCSWEFQRDLVRITGYDLFAAVSPYSQPLVNKQHWAALTEEQKQKFEGSREIDDHYRRIQFGYEYVKHSQDWHNPYKGLGLFPWEIVKDKLRNFNPARKTLDRDLYDRLIGEALAIKKLKVGPKLLFKCEQIWLDGQKTMSAKKANDRFKLLTEREKQVWKDREAKKLVHCEILKLMRQFNVDGNAKQTPYTAFYKNIYPRLKGVTLQEKNKIAGQKWRAMNEAERAAFPGDRSYFNSRVYKELLLDATVELVMDYIFKAGSVKGYEGDEWRFLRKSFTHDMHYLDRVYFPYIVQKDGDKMVLK